MEITLTRKTLAATFTLGVLVFGTHKLYTVEDTVRHLADCTQTTCVGKINGETAVPAGRYEVKDTYSPRFKKNVLELQDVPGFSGVRIHSGNTSDDTEGCLILGLTQTKNGVADSRAAMVEFNKLVREKLARGEKVFITIK